MVTSLQNGGHVDFVLVLAADLALTADKKLNFPPS